MTKRIVWAFLMMIPLTTISQEWAQYYVPCYRSIMEIHTINMQKIFTLVGWPYNDSMTFMSYSQDSGETWEFNNIFPGKRIMSEIYYNSGKTICASYNEACYKSSNYGETRSLGTDLNHININNFHKCNWGLAFACEGLESENFGEY